MVEMHRLDGRFFFFFFPMASRTDCTALSENESSLFLLEFLSRGRLSLQGS